MTGAEGQTALYTLDALNIQTKHTLYGLAFTRVDRQQKIEEMIKGNNNRSGLKQMVKQIMATV
jgi:hypothetical protein